MFRNRDKNNLFDFNRIIQELGSIKDLIYSNFKNTRQEFKADSIYLGDHTAICRTIFGRKIFIDTRDISLAPHLAMDGIWEMWITDAMSHLLKPDMACVDLGTNFGWYSLLMAEKIGSKGFLIGADANQRMVDLCRRSMSINGFLDRATIIHAAITDREGQVNFSALDAYMGSGSLNDMGDTATQFHDTATNVSVPAMTLDKLIGDRMIDFIKIDCEGAEPSIIRGGQKILNSPNIQIFMEYAPNFYAPGETVEMIDNLERSRFEFYTITTSSNFEKLTRDQLLNHSGWSELYLKRP